MRYAIANAKASGSPGGWFNLDKPVLDITVIKKLGYTFSYPERSLFYQ
jgi:hypothetical protein